MKKTATKKTATKKASRGDAPMSLDAHGVRIWQKWKSKVSDYDLLENYCIAYQTMIMAAISVNRDGILISMTSDRGYEQSKKNPACDVLATAQRTMIACSRKLGLNGDEIETDAFSEYD